MSLPVIPDPPKSLVDSIDVGLFTVGSVPTVLGLTYGAHIDSASAGAIGGAVGSSLVAARKVVSGLFAPIYARSDWVKKRQLRIALTRVRFMHATVEAVQGFCRLEPQEMLMLVELKGALDSTDPRDADALDAVIEVADRNLQRYKALEQRLRDL